MRKLWLVRIPRGPGKCDDTLTHSQRVQPFQRVLQWPEVALASEVFSRAAPFARSYIPFPA
jgi:hypothetical protein